MWTLDELARLIDAHDGLTIGTREGDCLVITNDDGLDAWLALSGEQILVESLLFEAGRVRDVAALNDEILRTHMLFPLTTVGITTVGDTDYYTAFGALSAQSKSESVLIEIDTLFENVHAFLEAYGPHLNA